MILTINDETLTGDLLNEIKIEVENELIKVKDLIASRVTAEVHTYNSKKPAYFKGLIEPTNAEKTLNGYKLKNRKDLIDVEQQIFVAYNAFQNNGYFILVDDEQAEDLEQEILVSSNTTVSFVKLTPLIGG